MKTKLLLLIAFVFGLTLQAQKYNFTLIQNSAYNFSVAAVPDFTSATPFRSDQNFTILVPDGITLSNVTGGYSVPVFTAIDAYAPGQDAIAFNLVQDIATPSTTGASIVLTTFDVVGSPTSGQIDIIGNTHALVVLNPAIFASRFLGPLSGNLGDPNTENYGGQTGTTSYLFAPLGVSDKKLEKLEVYPNPTKGEVFIKGIKDLQSIELFTITGQRVNSIKTSIDKVDMSNLQTGVYFMKITSVNGVGIKKVVKK